MSLLAPPRRFDPAVPEIMDRPGNDPELLRADLHVLEGINRFLGGRRIALGYLDDFLEVLPMNSLSILDLATGGADIPQAIVRWACGQGVRVEITAVDGNPEIARFAREQCADWPKIRIEQHDVLALPYPTASFDFVLCALTLHHFAEPEVVAILRRIHDIARVGYIINDLRRNRIAICLSKLMARTIITNPIARFDAPASCERAFTIAELRGMAAQAGMVNVTIRRHRFFRMALTGRK
jgi:2-polyprenyl-3-methyl-5-hydroxy-6-metoxy-1,4-benzoquinol methylase